MITNCAITRKRCYTKDEAKKALRAILRKGSYRPGKFGFRAYYCDWCMSHHIGNKYHA